MNDFTSEWLAVEDQVRRYCYRCTSGPSLADDVLQETRIRAWRGFASFQGRSSFLTWVLTIARREVSRQLGRVQVFVPINDIAEPAAPPEQVTIEPVTSLDERITAAVEAGHLTSQKGSILQARLADPDASWEAIGAALSLTAGHCAVLHLRGIQDLRTFLLLRHDPLLGGLDMIKGAFADAMSAAGSRRLNLGEAAVFRQCVLDEPPSAPTRRQMGDLRKAATKVASYLSWIGS